jgi:hypothetical protein
MNYLQVVQVIVRTPLGVNIQAAQTKMVSTLLIGGDQKEVGLSVHGKITGCKRGCTPRIEYASKLRELACDPVVK